MLKLNEMTINHNKDISLIAKSEDLMRKMQLQQTDSEKQMYKQQNKIMKLEKALSHAERDRDDIARRLREVEAGVGARAKGAEDIKLLEELHEHVELLKV